MAECVKLKYLRDPADPARHLIVRVTAEDAEKMVATGEAVRTSKGAWKAGGRRYAGELMKDRDRRRKKR